MPKVSVIVPAYNQSQFLGEAVESVLNQTFDDLEVIIVDDGSTDDTPKVAQSFVDPRVKYIRQENRGLAGARNTGLRASRGEYIAFLDSDDTFLPHKLDVQVQSLDRQPEVGLVTGGWVYMDKNGVTLQEGRPWLDIANLDLKAWLFDCPFIVHSVLVRRSWLEQVGGFDEQFRRVEDWDLWLRLAHAGCHMAWVESVVCCYRLHGTNMVRDAVSQTKGFVTMLDKFFTNVSASDEVNTLRSPAYARIYLGGAAREYSSGQIEQAKADLNKAIQFNPALLDDRGEYILDQLVAWSGNPLVGTDPFAYINSVFDHLPETVGPLRHRRKEAFARVAMARFFKAHRQGDRRTVRQMFLIMLKYDPTWLRNRGVISILIQTFLPAKYHTARNSCFGKES